MCLSVYTVTVLILPVALLLVIFLQDRFPFPVWISGWHSLPCIPAWKQQERRIGVSVIAATLDAEIADLAEGPLDARAIPYIGLDATYVKCRRGGRVASTAVVTAIEMCIRDSAYAVRLFFGIFYLFHYRGRLHDLPSYRRDCGLSLIHI